MDGWMRKNGVSSGKIIRIERKGVARTKRRRRRRRRRRQKEGERDNGRGGDAYV